MRLFDVQLPWFIPMYRRIVVVAILLFWTVVELSQQNAFWGVLFGALTVYCAHQFFIAFNPVMPKEETKEKSEDTPE